MEESGEVFWGELWEEEAPCWLCGCIGSRRFASFQCGKMALQSVQQWAGCFRQIRNIAFVDADILPEQIQKVKKIVKITELNKKNWALIASATYLGHFQEFTDAIHSHQEPLIQIQCVFALFFIHVKVLFQQIDDAIVVTGK